MPWGVAAAAAVSIGSSYLSSESQKDAAEDAANAQNKSSDAAIAQQNKQFEALQALLKPYTEAGTGALSAQQNLLGLNGNAAQASAIGNIQNGSNFQMLNQAGQNSVLQNAAATGGLRGGNTQSSLANYSSNLLNSLVQQQYSNLGGLTSIGQNAAAGVGNAGMTNASQISNLLQSQGSANAANSLAAGQANSQLYSSIGSSLGSLIGAF